MEITNSLKAWVDANRDVTLRKLDDSEFLTGSHIDAVLKLGAFIEGPRSAINGANWWNLTVGQLFDRCASADGNAAWYAIHDSKTGEELTRVLLPADHVEGVSSDNDEGHFRADRLNGLEEYGERSVYAILL